MVNYIKKNLHLIILIVFVLFLPIVSLAQNTNCQTNPSDPGCQTNPPSSSSTGSKIENPIKSGTIVGLIKTILEGVIKIGMPVLVLAIIYCGFLFVSAQGNSEKIGEAKDSLLYTLIGAAILLGSWAIAQLIVDTVKAL